MTHLHRFVFLAFQLSLCLAQSSQPPADPSLCVKGSPVTAFPNCDYMDNTITTCNSTTSNQAQFLGCFCTQAVLNSIVGCESEYRLCFGNDDYDSSAQEMLSIWHQGCDGFISFTPTTPPLSTPSVTYNVDECTLVYSSCAAGSYAVEQCSSSFPSATQSQLSCACQPSVLSLAYTCEFIGNQSCVQTSAALSDVFGYSFCPGFKSLFGSGSATKPPSVSASQTPTSGSTIAPTNNGSATITALSSNSKPTLPSLSTSTLPTSTKSSEATLMSSSYSASLISLLLLIGFWLS